ncbi:AAA domain-containing protein [Cereibacter sediminicola]|uniref:AAA domain-containing protein n=1 Tax=Cereibacter sediminicola TaxID=2584941 RepID=UPI001C9313DC|nr:AAA domain-containing protein [Cereibacter sediminicola]
MGTTFRHEERMALLGELEALAREGSIRRRHDGRWIPIGPPMTSRPGNPTTLTSSAASETTAIVAAPFRRTAIVPPSPTEEGAGATERIDPKALLRYWRSALRADPRGAITEAFDRHGTVWHLISGQGPLLPDEGQVVRLRIDLDALAPEFRAALVKREANENALAIGWPLALGRRSGAPAIWPVGLIAAEWRRASGCLEIDISADDVLVNPDWLRGAARSTGWSAKDLEEVFAEADGVGLEGEDFLSRLRDAAATQVRGKLTGAWLSSEIDPQTQGILDAAALFLPEDSSFTAGAVRDLDAISEWPEAQLARTALAPLLGLDGACPSATFPAINVGTLNAEQIAAVRSACHAPLTVVTGPPGTGKSQAIVSMAASVLLTGGSVLVASKNHQALDAVQERLGGLAPEAPFVVRTLDPSGEVDRSFQTVLRELVQGETGRMRQVDETLLARLRDLAGHRASALDLMARRGEVECELADLLERIEARRIIPRPDAPTASLTPASRERTGLVDRLVALLRKLIGRNPPNSRTIGAALTGLDALVAELARLRAVRDGLAEPADVIALTDEIADLSRKLLTAVLMSRTTVASDMREMLDQAQADLDFAGRKAVLPPDMVRAVLAHRPLWLVSVLGAPKRLPLEDGIFDLVIFDEASQCDIASALPLFARARRAVVVGDNRQLNFIPQLGQAQDRNLMQAQGLPVTRMSRFAQSRQSLFDFAHRMPGAARILLRQQYRSVGPIVDYISREFYGSELKTAYDPGKIRPPANVKPGLAWTHVPAPAVLDANNVNRAEVAAITAHVETLLMREGYTGTLGVTSPFRGQVYAIDEAVRGAIPSHKLEAAEFRVATVDGFQGQERDVILFSPTLTATSRITSISFVQKDHRRLNVAISRARAVAHVFGDLDFARSRAVKTLAALAAAATEPRRRSGEGVFDSDWERILFHALQGRGLNPMPQYDIAGRRLDFALFGTGGIKLDLEVDGRQFHEAADGRRKLSDHWRDHQLKSLGWRVRRFWVDELARNMEACLDLVERDLS